MKEAFALRIQILVFEMHWLSLFLLLFVMKANVSFWTVEF